MSHMQPTLPATYQGQNDARNDRPSLECSGSHVRGEFGLGALSGYCPAAMSRYAFLSPFLPGFRSLVCIHVLACNEATQEGAASAAPPPPAAKPSTPSSETPAAPKEATPAAKPENLELTPDEEALLKRDPKELTPDENRKRGQAARKKILQNPDSPAAKALQELAEKVRRGEIKPTLPPKKTE